MFSFLYLILYAMGQQRIKRERRDRRRSLIKRTIKHIQWCQDNLSIREDGVDRPVTVAEAAEFIWLTSQQQQSKQKIDEDRK